MRAAVLLCVAGATAIMIALVGLALDQDKALQQCRKTHSHNVCFQELYR